MEFEPGQMNQTIILNPNDFDDFVFQCFGVFSCTNLASKSP